MTPNQKHNKDFYFEYHRIGNRAFRDKVRYYEDNRYSIQHLSYEERIDVDLDYVICLFEIGKYHKFLSKVDALIEIVIIDNIFTYNGLNIYNNLLFKKAACLYNTGQYINSEKVLLSVIKIEPDNETARILFGKCKRKQIHTRHEGTKTIAILFLIIGLVMGITEIVLIKYFLSEQVSVVQGIKSFFGLTGIFILLFNEAYLKYIIGQKIGYNFDFPFLKKKTNK